MNNVLATTVLTLIVLVLVIVVFGRHVGQDMTGNLVSELFGAIVTVAFIQYYADSQRSRRSMAIAKRALGWPLERITVSMSGLTEVLVGATSTAEQWRKGKDEWIAMADEIAGFANIWVGVLDIDVLDRCRRMHNHLKSLAAQGGEQSYDDMATQVIWILDDVLMVCDAIDPSLDRTALTKLVDQLTAKFPLSAVFRYKWEED